jgi:hypothetical protein
MCKRVAAGLVCVLALGGVAGAGEPSPSPATIPAWAEELLRASDVGSFSPQSFRARMRLGDAKGIEIEVWRSGATRTLVRFLDPKERGKYLLRRDDDLWFLAPGARKPVRLKPSYRLRGNATLDDILGLQHASDYAIAGVEEGADGLVTFDLVARARSAPYARVRYVVLRPVARPVRAEYRLPSGKTASEVEFVEWAPGRRAWATRLTVRDRLRGGPATDVRVVDLEERPVPEGLFSLDDSSERRRLEGP